MSRFRFALAVCALLLAAAPARAELIFESGDAGNSLSSAQVIKSTDPVDIVRGMLSRADDVDVFQFTLEKAVIGITSFSARTTNIGDDGFVHNPLLHFYDGAGNLLLSGKSIDLGTQPGAYFLAISSGASVPKGSSGSFDNFGEYRIVVTRNVPEPGSLTLLALGAAALTGYTRWRRGTPAVA
jgi:hypothetical protein